MIFIFAAIATFILFKLKQQFGKIAEDRRRDEIKKFVKEKTNSNFADLAAKIKK